jgi:hypothetical protein
MVEDVRCIDPRTSLRTAVTAYNAPESLSADEVYALGAFLLNQNGIVPPDMRLDAQSLQKVRMPNRDGFVPDPRPGRL